MKKLLGILIVLIGLLVACSSPAPVDADSTTVDDMEESTGSAMDSDVADSGLDESEAVAADAANIADDLNLDELDALDSDLDVDALAVE